MSAGDGGERSTHRAREAGPPSRQEGWSPEEGGQQVLEGLQRGDSGYWRGCGGGVGPPVAPRTDPPLKPNQPSTSRSVPGVMVN